MADPDDELLEAVRELTRTIEDLRSELESTQRRPADRSPFPRPPRPRELLRLTDEVAIPATVAVLETSVRALEGFQRALRVARTEREVRDRTSEATTTAGRRANDLRRTTLSQLDTVLAQLQQATSEGTVPANDAARELLDDARSLRDDVDSRLQDVGTGGADVETDETGSSGGIRIDVEEGSVEDADGDDPDPSVDVDAELETLKDQYGDEETDSSGGDESDEGSSVEGDENGPAGDSDGNDDDPDGASSSGDDTGDGA